MTVGPTHPSKKNKKNTADLYPLEVLEETCPMWAPLHVVRMLRLVFDINQLNLPTPFCSVLVSVSVSVALSTTFHSINSPDNSPLSHCALPVSFLSYWSCQLYISL